MSIYALHLNDQEYLAESFRQALRIAATVILPSDTARDEAKAVAWFPRLTEMKAQGSVNQYLRYLNARQLHFSFFVDEHEVGGPPDCPTFRARFDFNSGLDVSYEVQSRLWDIGFHRTHSAVPALTDDLFDAIQSGLEKARSATGDADVLQRLQIIEQRMGGIATVPSVGRPSAILDRLADHACDLFEDIAYQAFSTG
ncbi:hypothetical protein [Rhizobium sp. BK176]|uniref:hypothetical protein n=1 Tax=Rhizobium sp. BK176 TaxID=2587071 RepID=UPI00216782CD|nr:hypothetical protein [Rhizobium sp. BK176]MCS4089214.1 hypothetical protein [Rhizobium sp. BK176]